jgi:hydrogenase expression/formation protein HypE
MHFYSAQLMHFYSAVDMRSDPAWAKTPGGVQSFRDRMHAGQSLGSLHGQPRGRVRGALSLWPVSDQSGGARMMDGFSGASGRRNSPFPRGLDLKRGAIDMTHGAGGRASAQLFHELILPALINPALAEAEDQGRVPIGAERLVTSTDAYVVTPIQFPGGDIGKLAVHGTINDLAMAGAEPVALTLALIVAEGTPLALVREILASVGEAAREAGVPIVSGDTKVVERGRADPLYLITSGIGRIPASVPEPPAAARIRDGDVVLVSGFLGDHGVAVMCARGDLPLAAPVESDTAALHRLVADLLSAAPGVRALRDPTRGGIAATLNEFAWTANLGCEIDEAALPIRPAVEAACDLLGLDPLNVANEGKLVAIVPAAEADVALAALRAHPLGQDAALIGRFVHDPDRFVRLRTKLGGQRMIDWLSGDPLPRIC